MKNILQEHKELFLLLTIFLIFVNIGFISALNANTWYANSTINNSIPQSGNNHYYYSDVFNVSGRTFLIIQNSSTNFLGYEWNGGGWTANSTVYAGLTNPSSMMDIFWMGNDLYLMKWNGLGGGLFGLAGYVWNGSGWTSNSTIASGYPTGTPVTHDFVVFELNGIYYMLAGTRSSYDVNGWRWTGSGWVTNSTINNSLDNYVYFVTPNVIKKDNDIFAIVNPYTYPTIGGYKWNGAGWSNNFTINQSSPSYLLSYPPSAHPDFFWINNNLYGLIGDSTGKIYGVSYYIPPPDNSNPVITYEIPTPSNTSLAINPVTIVANISDASDTSSWVDMEGDVKLYLGMDSYNSTGLFDNSTYNKFVRFNGTLTTSDIVNGSRGEAIQLDGSSDYLSLGNYGLSEFTISFWINYKNNLGIQSIIGTDETTGFRIYTNNGKVIVENSGLNMSGSILNNIAVHIVVTENSTGTFLWANGALNNKNSNIPEIYNPINSNLALGRYNKSQYLNASIDELLIFDRALSSTEIKALYSSRTNKLNSTYDFSSNGQKDYWTWAIDEAGNFVKNYRYFTVSGIVPTLSVQILSPFEYQSFSANQPIQFNVTEQNANACWYSNNSGATNYTYTCGNNFTITENIDGLKKVTVWINNTIGNITSAERYYNIVPPPAVSLYSPVSNSWVNTNNIPFYFIPSDNDGISQCSLYQNSSGTWTKSYTWDNPSNNVMTSTNININDTKGVIWNVVCNDTFNNINWAVNNETFNIDTIFPSNAITNIGTTTGNQLVSFTTSISDSNNYTCRYSVYNLAGGVDGLNYNVPFDCSTASFYVSGFATFNLRVYATDEAGNQNLTTQNFIVFAQSVNPPAGGGGGGGTPVLSEGNWTMETDFGGSSYQFTMIQGSSRSGNLLFENLGTTSRTLKMTCEPVSGTQNLCDTLTFEQTTFTLPLQRGIKTSTSFEVVIPDNYEKESYVANLIATDEDGNKGIITITVDVASYASITGAITKLFSSTEGGIPYLLFFFLIAFMTGTLSYFTIFKPNKIPTAFSVLVGLVFGIIFLLLPI